jgi:DNA replication protein DnaC
MSDKKNDNIVVTKPDMIPWTEKYKPRILADIIGNKQQIYQIMDWLKNYDKNKKIYLANPRKRKKNNIKLNSPDIEEIDNDNEHEFDAQPYDIDLIPDLPFSKPISKSNKKKKRTDEQCSSLIIIGDHGVGKTVTINAILNELHYDVQTINLSKLGSNKNVNEMVEKLVKSTNIFDKIIGSSVKNPAIIIDELEAVNSQAEKNFISTLFKYNDEHWTFPIIFISNGKHSKVTSTLKENAKTIYFGQPNYDNLMKLLIYVSTKENLQFEHVDVAKLLLQHVQHDFRRLLFILQDLKSNYTGEPYSIDEIEKYCEISKKKDLDLDIYTATAELMSNYQNIDECLRLYEGEKVIIPLMVQQNYIKIITNSIGVTKETYTLIEKISKSIARGDVVENHIYSDQNWDMIKIHGILTCVIPSFILKKSKINTNTELLKRQLDFPDDLNRTSIKRINKRNVVNSNNCIKNMNVEDFIKANKLIRKLIADEKIKECAEIFKGYSAKVENIESILKIDKISDQKLVDPKKIISNSVKKQLAQILATQE